MRIHWKKLLICLGIPLAVGGLAALLSGGMESYALLEKPQSGRNVFKCK